MALRKFIAAACPLSSSDTRPPFITDTLNVWRVDALVKSIGIGTGLVLFAGLVLFFAPQYETIYCNF